MNWFPKYPGFIVASEYISPLTYQGSRQCLEAGLLPKIYMFILFGKEKLISLFIKSVLFPCLEIMVLNAFANKRVQVTIFLFSLISKPELEPVLLPALLDMTPTNLKFILALPWKEVLVELILSILSCFCNRVSILVFCHV